MRVGDERIAASACGRSSSKLILMKIVPYLFKAGCFVVDDSYLFFHGKFLHLRFPRNLLQDQFPI
jgi:hypothetical protein